VEINCVYDEQFSDVQPLSRWFEVEPETPIFDLSIDPVDYEGLMTKEFKEVEVLTVAPEGGTGEQRMVPRTINFEISYYQINRDLKRLILVEMEFSDIEELSDAEYLGEEQVAYKVVFNFIPLSHLDLTIAFAFSW